MPIISEAAYALSKMSYGGDWREGEKSLPRGSFPSDVDMFFDNLGAVLFGELSRFCDNWLEISWAQRTGYENIIANSKHCAVLCRHKVDWEANKYINTRTDIVSFQPMISYNGKPIYLELFEGNERWQNFVFSWYENPRKLWEYLASGAE